MIQNKYCPRCKRTERFEVEGTVYTCPSCGVCVDMADKKPVERTFIGNPMASYRIREGGK